MYCRMVLMVICWRYGMRFDANSCVSTLMNVDQIKWMYFCVNEFEVGVYDSVLSGNEQQKVYSKAVFPSGFKKRTIAKVDWGTLKPSWENFNQFNDHECTERPSHRLEVWERWLNFSIILNCFQSHVRSIFCDSIAQLYQLNTQQGPR